jgi:hypothetical protein
MAENLDQVARGALLECFRDVRKDLGYGTATEAADAIVAVNAAIKREVARKVVYHHSVKSGPQGVVAAAILEILKKNREMILSRYSAASTKAYLENLFSGREATVSPSPMPVPRVETTVAPLPIPVPPTDSTAGIFKNWVSRSQLRPDLLGSGLYQIFRRYKPINDTERNNLKRNSAKRNDAKPGPKAGYDWTNSLNHAVVCELALFEMEARKCYLVTSEGRKYTGTLHLNHEEILFALLQRHIEFQDGVNHRFLAMKLPQRHNEFASGVLVKVGDTMRRPLASEIILHKVPPSYTKLLEAFKTEVVQSPGPEALPDNSEILNYVTAHPPGPDPFSSGEWGRVKFVRDFPALTKLVKPQSSGIVYLREPSRSLGIQDLYRLMDTVMPVFRHNDDDDQEPGVK